MGTLKPFTLTCPVCGNLIGFNRVVTAVKEGVLIRPVIDDLSVRRHRTCGITPERPREPVA